MTNGWGTNGGGPLPPQQPSPAGQVQFDEPDWAALADQHQREQSRRKRMKAAGGVLAAVVAVGGITAVAAATSSSGEPKADPTVVVEATSAASQQPDTGGDPSPSALPSDSPSASAPASASASASAPASPSRGASKGPGKAPSSAPAASPAGPPDPLTVISSAATDTAPLTPAGVLPAATVQVNGKTWTRLADAQTATCYQATTGGLGNVLAAQGCRSMIRVTYTSGNSAVTVGIAVLDTKAQADAVIAAFTGQVQGLVPSGHTAYCTSTGCQGTHASIGRYVYLTVSGTVNPGGTAADATATAAGPSFAATARDQLLARGRR
ncbi:hypothetical protein Kpho02_02170 [Kitasatospora phosalacinea]|uniref:Uncharacterized protein n=1 Tax=Kitasatospora phosalacinea TaxID=2065 RepID=A0A9W6Q3L8_9ACTN|nr:hypothetical protein [Kitasatospora phosalacinea]GLW67918.1 hypothetical protein Kpho02_02170 [Kitasatospora phosalacinea]